jgi:glutamate dehydrogenase (NADP+)
VVTLSDSDDYIYDEGGIDKKELSCVLNLKNVKRGRIKDCAKEFNCKYFEKQRPWNVKCDVAFPSATQNEIDESDAKSLVKNGCIAVAEGANMPTTPEGVEVFQKAKILYAPGKASNAGGVATSGLEMSQNSIRLSWTREEVDKRLHDIMIAIHEQCVKYGKESGQINYVNGANIAGFVKVADAMLSQGLV